MQALTNTHWQALKCVLRYVLATLFECLHLQKSSLFSLNAFSYADWGRGMFRIERANGRKSCFGVLIWSHGASINNQWVEYQSASNRTSELEWIKMALVKLGILIPNLIVVWCDIQVWWLYQKILHITSNQSNRDELSFHLGTGNGQNSRCSVHAIKRPICGYVNEIIIMHTV